MFPRTFRLRAIAVAGMLLAALLAPSGANAWAVGGATIVGNYCMPSALTWKGDVRYESRSGNPSPHQTTGTAKYCANWYRINDADSAADYYLLTVRVTWTVSYQWGGSDNFSSAKLTSSIAALGGSYEASPDQDVTYGGSCSSPVTISVGAGIFGASVDLAEILCDSGRLKFVGASASQATWSSTNVTKTPKWEIAYAVKVGQGKHPYMGVSWEMPCYRAYTTSTVTPAWVYTKEWCTQGISRQL